MLYIDWSIMLSDNQIDSLNSEWTENTSDKNT